ncbi:MAG TPA: hypothetical protein VNX86_10960 [Rhizomicrobium sp.]|nr:hypothetical protein [Rhizomicrobium sp.]
MKSAIRARAMRNHLLQTKALQSLRNATAILVVACIGAAGCGPQEGGSAHHGGHGLLGMHHGGLPLLNRAMRMGMRGTRARGFRRACADDMARLCPNAKSHRDERECLEGKRDSLEAECKTALDARRNRGAENTR